MRKLVSLSIVSFFVFVGCSTPYREAPQAKNFKKSSQYKLQALSHWQIISKDYAKYLLSKIDKNYVYKIVYYQKTPFKEGFSKFLESELVNSGVKISLDNYDKIIEINEEAFKFRKNRAKYNNLQGVVALGSGVGALIYKLADSGNPVAATGAGIISLEAFLAANSKYSNIPQYEILVNSRIYDKKTKILEASISRAYYIADADKDLYLSKNYEPIYLEGK